LCSLGDTDQAGEQMIRYMSIHQRCGRVLDVGDELEKEIRKGFGSSLMRLVIVFRDSSRRRGDTRVAFLSASPASAKAESLRFQSFRLCDGDLFELRVRCFQVTIFMCARWRVRAGKSRCGNHRIRNWEIDSA
jgi:hypothetical protein